MASSPISTNPTPADKAEPDYAQALARFQHFQKKAQESELSADEIRECIDVTRILRRTNTGPGKAKTGRGKKATPSLSLDDI